jgi:YebC/PmpR family DNA-binding regulatory protein
MSGHSKWSTIKRKKGAIDAARSKVFQKLAKELYVAAKSGDSDPNNNAALRMVVEKAKAENMPKANIESAIAKAASKGASEDYESVRYEGYGPNGIAIMIDCLTDNKNRTAMLVRSTLTKHGGNLGTDGSVSYMFKRRGVIELEKKYDFDKVMDIAISSEADDVMEDDDVYTIYTDPNNFIQVKESLENEGINEFLTSEITYVADNKISLDDEKTEKVMNLIDLLNDIDDVSDVYHNLEV